VQAVVEQQEIGFLEALEHEAVRIAAESSEVGEERRELVTSPVRKARGGARQESEKNFEHVSVPEHWSRPWDLDARLP
jgi:hypothetical protein